MRLGFYLLNKPVRTDCVSFLAKTLDVSEAASQTSSLSIFSHCLVQSCFLFCSVVKNTLIKTESETWKIKTKLFLSISESTFLYLCEIWCLSYADIMEKAPLYFFKSILYLLTNTPGYLLWLEIGQTQIKNLPKNVNLVLKLLKLESQELPKICYMHQSKLLDAMSIPFNWSHELRNYIITVGAEDILMGQDEKSVRCHFKNLIEKMENYLINKNIETAMYSKSNVFYKNISLFGKDEYLKI